MTAAPDVAQEERLATNRLGLWLFFLSETMLFLGLIVARFFLQGTFVPDEVDQVIGLVITSILLASSFTAYRAEVFSRYGDDRQAIRNVRWTVLLGIVFLFGVGFEWAEALDAFPPSTGFGTVFFTMTGVHAFHVITGIGALSLVLVYGRRRALNPWGVEATVKYWHFVDVVWVFFYPVLYLVS
jgi:cytochrome c oxidase subunit 3